MPNLSSADRYKIWLYCADSSFWLKLTGQEKRKRLLKIAHGPVLNEYAASGSVSIEFWAQARNSL